MEQALYNSYPTINNRYHVIESLGSGGMANVYLAYDEILGREVALKVLSNRFANDDEFVERFKREARISAALSHPNIAPVHDLGETPNGSYYMAMEYVPGETLRDLIRRKGPLAPSKAVEIATQVALALEAAHARGTIHRDIKPQNILLTKERVVKVVDFGIARAAVLSRITREGCVLGTEHYMSPEQARGAPVGPESDLYSLGVVLYEMLTGKLPHEAYGPLLGSTTVTKRLRGYPRPPKEIDPLIPEKLSAITVRLLSQDPKHRYPNAASLLADLQKTKRESLASTATRILSSAFQRSRTLGSVTTRVLNSAAQQPQTAYKSKTHKTKPYAPPAPRHISSRERPTPRKRNNTRPRFLLVLLTLAAILALLHLGPGAKAQLLGEAQREIGDGLTQIERSLTGVIEEMEGRLESALWSGLANIEHKLFSSFEGIVTPSPGPQQGPQSYPNYPKDPGGSSPRVPDEPSNNRPDSAEGSFLPPQSNAVPQSPYPRSPSYPGNAPGGQFSPGDPNPSPYSLPNNGVSRQGSYQQPRQ